MPDRTTTPAAPLSSRLREGTEIAHESAERATFLGRLLDGRLDLRAWKHLLEQYEGVYRALEACADAMRENHACVELFSIELDRRTAISADLRALDARLGDERIGLLPSTRDYAERILSCRNDPFRLLAHHYTRYLGDLSGGQAMRVMLDRAYGLPDEQAAFFRFEEIGPIPPFKRRYRAALDRLELRRDDADRLVDEAIASFDCNARIFTDLEEIVATPRPALTA